MCAATTKGGKTYEAKTTVNVFVPIESISVDKKNVILAASSEYTAKFSYKTGDQAENEYQMHKPILTFTPSDASIQQLEWSSGEEMIARVTDDGTIYGISVGTTTITGKAMDGSGKSVKIEVTVPECFVTEDNFTITEPEGAILGYVRPRNFIGNGSGFTTLNLRTKGDQDVFAIADLDDYNGMEMLQIVPLKAGEASLVFVRNGRAQKTENIKVQHSAVYDNISYPPVKVSSILNAPEESIGTKTQVKCEIINIIPRRSLGKNGGIVYGMLNEGDKRRYVIFEFANTSLCKVGTTQTIYGTVSDFAEYVTDTGLTYMCPYFTGGHINRF